MDRSGAEDEQKCFEAGFVMNCKICGALLKQRQKKVCSRKCLGEHLSTLYRGKGKSLYIQIRVNGGRIYFHRRVWEKANGRKPEFGEIVHHVNEDKRDNRAENLEVLAGKAAHLHIHNYHRKNRTGTADDFSDIPF